MSDEIVRWFQLRRHFVYLPNLRFYSEKPVPENLPDVQIITIRHKSSTQDN